MACDLIIQSGTPFSEEPMDGLSIFLRERMLVLINYSELAARVRAAKYSKRPCPVVNCIDCSYVLWDEETHLITKFEMDDGDQYYVISICYENFRYGSQYIGKTIFIYSSSIQRARGNGNGCSDLSQS